MQTLPGDFTSGQFAKEFTKIQGKDIEVRGAASQVYIVEGISCAIGTEFQLAGHGHTR